MGSEQPMIPARLTADGWAWELTTVGAVHGGRVSERRHRLRVRTAEGEKSTDLTPAELPVRIAELCERLGLKGVTMDQDFDLGKLAAMKREQLDDVDGEIAALQARRAKLAREVKAIEKCAAMLDEKPSGSRAVKPRAPKAASGPTMTERVLQAVASAPNATAKELAGKLGVERHQSVAIVCAQLERRGELKRIGDGFRLAKRAA